ncbi:MAG: FecR domain-containing protein, partial [Bacteroidales bacterium]|nr:FecR domain-containing protein [Bacteroidales bacterium]
MPENYTDIEKALLDYLDGTTSEDDLLSLQEWLKQSGNQKELNNIHDIYLASSILKSDSIYDPENAWAAFRKVNLKKTGKNKNSIIKLYGWSIKVAAVLLIVIAGTFFIYKQLRIKTSVPETTFSEFNVPRGSRSHIFLPDGTSVWLNAESSLKFSQSFGKNQRDIILSGEAFFDVVRNEKIPFVVKAKNTIVKVLGTSFNIKAYPDENFVETTVVRGKVQVSSPEIKNDSLQQVTLTANQKVKITGDISVVENTTD